MEKMLKMMDPILEFMRTHQMIPVYLMGLMLLWMVGLIVYAIYQTIKTEKKGKVFRTTLNVGDKAYFSRADNRSVDCEVIDTDAKGDGQFVSVKVIVRKSSLYPDNDASNQLNRA